MMDWRTDLEELAEHVEVLLACVVGQAEVVCLARRHRFGTGEPSVKRWGWQSTWDGAELPAAWRPYCYAVVTAPDPALLDEGY